MKLTTQARHGLESGQFAGPNRSYPVEDKAHARAALSRASANASPALQAKIKAKVRSKFPTIEVGAKKFADGGVVGKVSNLMESTGRLFGTEKAKAIDKANASLKAPVPQRPEVAGGDSVRAMQVDDAEQEALGNKTAKYAKGGPVQGRLRMSPHPRGKQAPVRSVPQAVPGTVATPTQAYAQGGMVSNANAPRGVHGDDGSQLPPPRDATKKEYKKGGMVNIHGTDISHVTRPKTMNQKRYADGGMVKSSVNDNLPSKGSTTGQGAVPASISGARG